MKTNSILLNAMYNRKEFEDDDLFPIENTINEFWCYYKSIVDQMANRKQSMLDVSQDALIIYEEGAKEMAEKSDVDINGEKAYVMFLMNNYFAEINQLDQSYPKYFRRFFMTQLYSFVETELKFICETINSKKMHLKNMKEVSSRNGGSYFEKYLNYLIEYEKIDKNTFSIELDFFNDLRLYRNLVVHNFAIIASDNLDYKKIKSWIESNKGIELKQLLVDDDYEILINDDVFIKQSIDMIISFYKKLLQDNGLFIDK
jgi:hypothetical protein